MVALVQSIPAVSVVMSVRNGAAYIPRAVDSILTQSLSDLELVIVDDGSTDAAPQILAGYAGRDSRVRVVTQPAEGIATALNRGIAATRGALIGVLDSDDIALPDRFEKQVAWMETHPEVAVLGGRVITIDARDRKIRVQACALDAVNIRNTLENYGSALFHPSIVMRKTVVVSLGGYRSAFDVATDYDLLLRVSERADIANLPEVLIYYRRHGGQMSVSRAAQQAAAAEVARVVARARREGKPDLIDAGFTLDDVRRLNGLERVSRPAAVEANKSSKPSG